MIWGSVNQTIYKAHHTNELKIVGQVNTERVKEQTDNLSLCPPQGLAGLMNEQARENPPV